MASGTEDTSTPAPVRLLDQVRERIRFRHYSIRTEQVYVDWIRRFIRFHGKRHPSTMGAAEVERFSPTWRGSRRFGVDAESGAKCAPFSLQGRSARRAAMAQRCRACEEAHSTARCVNKTGGVRGAARFAWNARPG